MIELTPITVLCIVTGATTLSIAAVAFILWLCTL